MSYPISTIPQGARVLQPREPIDVTIPHFRIFYDKPNENKLLTNDQELKETVSLKNMITFVDDKDDKKQFPQKTDAQYAQYIELLTNMTPTDIKSFFNITAEGPLRNLFEKVGAGDQCRKAGVELKRGITPCWICGNIIKEGEPADCEHIIPALRATMFSGLITTRTVTDKLKQYLANTDTYFKATYNNYLWAHQDCNASGGKSGMVLITYDEDKKKFVPDLDKCSELQKKIDGIVTTKGRTKGYKDVSITYEGHYTNPIYKSIPTGRNGVDALQNLYKHELEKQCEAINQELEWFIKNELTFGDYAKYCLEKVKLYIDPKYLENPQKKLEDMREIQDKYFESVKKSLDAERSIGRVSPEQKKHYIATYIELILQKNYIDIDDPNETLQHHHERNKSFLTKKVFDILEMKNAIDNYDIVDLIPIVLTLTKTAIFTSLNDQSETIGHKYLLRFDKAQDYLLSDKSYSEHIISIVKGTKRTTNITRGYISDNTYTDIYGNPDTEAFKNQIYFELDVFIYRMYQKIASNVYSQGYDDDVARTLLVKEVEKEVKFIKDLFFTMYTDLEEDPLLSGWDINRALTITEILMWSKGGTYPDHLSKHLIKQENFWLLNFPGWEGVKIASVTDVNNKEAEKWNPKISPYKKNNESYLPYVSNGETKNPYSSLSSNSISSNSGTPLLSSSSDNSTSMQTNYTNKSSRKDHKIKGTEKVVRDAAKNRAKKTIEKRKSRKEDELKLRRGMSTGGRRKTKKRKMKKKIYKTVKGKNKNQKKKITRKK